MYNNAVKYAKSEELDMTENNDTLNFEGAMENPSGKRRNGGTQRPAKKKSKSGLIVTILFLMVAAFAILKTSGIGAALGISTINLDEPAPETTQASKTEPAVAPKEISNEELTKKQEALQKQQIAQQNKEAMNEKAAKEFEDIEKRKDEIFNNIEKDFKTNAQKENTETASQTNAVVELQVQKDEDSSNWKRRIASLFKNDKDVVFILDADIPSIIANNFRQEAYNQYRIAGTDARISNISFVQPRNHNDFLDIKVTVESLPPTPPHSFEKLYPISNYVKLDFFDDAIVKTSRNKQETLVEGDFIFPYMQIKKIGQLENGRIFAEIIITQDGFGGNNFVYRYERDMQ